jgi:hypothetical protein
MTRGVPKKLQRDDQRRKGAAQKRGVSDTPHITLAEAGIDKNLAKQARKFATLPPAHYPVKRAALGKRQGAREAVAPIGRGEK